MCVCVRRRKNKMGGMDKLVETCLERGERLVDGVRRGIEDEEFGHREGNLTEKEWDGSRVEERHAALSVNTLRVGWGGCDVVG